MYSQPLLPLDAAPVLNTTAPLLLTAVLLAAAVRSNNLPLDEAVLEPDVTHTSPPLFVASAVCPPVNVRLPPRPTVPAPTVIAMFPPAPPVDAPELTVTVPEPALVALDTPDVIVTAPVPTAVSPELIFTNPDVAVVDVPEPNVAVPLLTPVPAPDLTTTGPLVA